MALLGYGVGVCALAGACLLSPVVPPPEGNWQFQPAAQRSGTACSMVLQADEGQPRLVLARQADGTGPPTIYLAGGSAIPAGRQPASGTMEIAGSPPMSLTASSVGGEERLLRLDILDARPLSELAGLESEYGVLWLDLPGTLTQAFSLAGWHEAMTRLAACAD